MNTGIVRIQSSFSFSNNWALLILLAISLILTACGGGGGGTTPPVAVVGTLSGTAAAGAPIIGQVTVKDSAGVIRTEAIDVDGSFTVDVTGMSPPFMLHAEGTVGGRSYKIYSAATTADINGTINITPLTDLIVANIAQQVAEVYFDSGNFSSLTAAELDTAEAGLQQRLQDVLSVLGVPTTVDLFRTAFRTDHTGLDAVLDIVRVTVDPVANTALILNLINNTSITDDLSLQSDTSILDSTGTLSGLSDFDAIRSRFDSFAALFATFLPPADSTQLLAQFDQTGFLDDGNDLATFLGGITTQPYLVGVQFPYITIKSFTPASVGSNGTAVVSAAVNIAGFGMTDNFDTVMTGIYDVDTSGTNWVIAGNQQIAAVGAESRSILGFNESNPTQIESGMDFAIDAPPASGINYVVVTGPGLPTTGGGADGSSAGVLLASDSIDIGFFLVAGAYSSNLTRHPRAENNGAMYAFTDAEIAALPTDNLTYTAALYNDSGTLTDVNDLSDDVLLDTYSFSILKPPFAAGTLTAASFAVITAPTPAKYLTIMENLSGSALPISWTVPTGLIPESLQAVRILSGEYDSVGGDISPTDTSATLQFSAPTATVTGGFLDLVAADTYNRNYSYRMWVRP